jgi:hypothetical protein
VAFIYTIDTTRRVVTLSPQGVPSVEDWEDVLDRVAADPLFRRGFGVLSDRRHLHTEPDATYVRATIDAVFARRAAFGESRFAILTSHLATFGMARMAEALADNRGIAWRVFMDESEIWKWLASER